MNSTTIAMVLFLAAFGGWMWWRIRRTPPVRKTPPSAGSLLAVADTVGRGHSLEDLQRVPSEYAGRADLRQAVLVNDDTTPMDVVIFVLQNVFQFPDHLAFQATVATHAEGECVIAVLPAAVAAERIAAAREIMEKTGGYPLQIVARPLASAA